MTTAPPTISTTSSSPAIPTMASGHVTSLHLPPFFREDPHLWFLQAEAQLAARGISDEKVRFGLIVSALPSDIISEVRDCLVRPPDVNPYTHLKETLTKRVGRSEQQNIQRLLSTEQLGDRSPSQLLRRMRTLMGNSPTSGDDLVLRQLFLQRLPQQIRMVLGALPESSLEQLAESADRMLEAAPPSQAHVHAVSTKSSADVGLAKEVANLTRTVAALQRQMGRLTTTSHSPATRAQAPGATTSSSTGLCWYHERFGAKSTKCRAPCTYVASDSKPASTSQ